MFPRDVADDVLVVLHVVAHRLERCESDINLGLAGGCDFVMLAFDRDAGFLEFQTHFVADILQGVGRRYREVAFLRADLVAEVWKFFPRAVPMSLATVDRIGRTVPGVAETHVVEDEKFRFWSEVR